MRRRSASPSTRERRRLRRAGKHLPARYRAASLEGQAHLRNISQTGVFLCTDDELPDPGSTLTLVLEPEDGAGVEISATVRWTTAQLPPSVELPRGFGAQIREPTRAYHELLERLLLP